VCASVLQRHVEQAKKKTHRVSMSSTKSMRGPVPLVRGLWRWQTEQREQTLNTACWMKMDGFEANEGAYHHRRDSTAKTMLTLALLRSGRY